MYIEEKLDLIIKLLTAERADGAAVAALGEAKPSTRGRKAKGEKDGVATASDAVPAATTAVTEPSVNAASTSVSEVDPFADEKPSLPPAVSMDEVRKAVLALKDATDQATALAVLKKYGASNFGEVKPEVTGAIVADAKAALPKKAVVEEDPFAADAPAAAAKLTIEDVKAAIVKAQKITSSDIVQRVVMDNGGSTALPQGGTGPSLKALPEANYAKVIELIGKLPKTK